MDQKLIEQNSIINKNLEIINTQQKDNDELHDELDAMVNKVTMLTEDNRRFYSENHELQTKYKALKHSYKELDGNNSDNLKN